MPKNASAKRATIYESITTPNAPFVESRKRCKIPDARIDTPEKMKNVWHDQDSDETNIRKTITFLNDSGY